MIKRVTLTCALVLAVCFSGSSYGADDTNAQSIAQSAPQTADDCKGPPGKAVTSLPAPLDRWAQIVCTPVGPMIAAHKGWIWQNPGGYSLVFIPAQMKRINVPVLPGQVYFTKIVFEKIGAEEFKIPFAVFHSIFRNDPPPENGYRLDVSSSNGRSLRLYFLGIGDNRWGIWCTDGRCDPSSWFIVLDMAHEPEPISPAH